MKKPLLICCIVIVIALSGCSYFNDTKVEPPQMSLNDTKLKDWIDIALSVSSGEDSPMVLNELLVSDFMVYAVDNTITVLKFSVQPSGDSTKEAICYEINGGSVRASKCNNTPIDSCIDLTEIMDYADEVDYTELAELVGKSHTYSIRFIKPNINFLGIEDEEHSQILYKNKLYLPKDILNKQDYNLVNVLTIEFSGETDFVRVFICR